MSRVVNAARSLSYRIVLTCMSEISGEAFQCRVPKTSTVNYNFARCSGARKASERRDGNNKRRATSWIMVARKITRVLAADWLLPIIIVAASLRIVASLTLGTRSPTFRLLGIIPARPGPAIALAGLNGPHTAFTVLGAALIVGRMARHELVLRIVNLIVRSTPEVFHKPSAATQAITARVVNR